MNIIKESWYKLKAWKISRDITKFEKEQLDRGTARTQILAFLACPAHIEPTKDGYYVNINGGEEQRGGMVAQALIIGKTNQHDDIRKGYDEDFSDRTVDELIRLSTNENAAIIYGHITMPIDPLLEAKMLDNSAKKADISDKKIQSGDQETVNTIYNSLNKKELKKHTEKVYNGSDHYYNFGLCAAVFGKTKKDVDDLIDTLCGTLDECGVRYETPVNNQLNIIKTIIPGNFIDPSVLQPTAGATVSKMLPLRAINPAYPADGIILGVDDTGKPIRVEFSIDDAGHSFIMGKTGSGKTVYECTWAARALGMGHRVIILQPKDEKHRGTDYKNFCAAYGGKLLRLPEHAPNFLQVFYDPKIMGTSEASYSKALQDHYETMKGFMAAWIGPSFRKRKKGMFIKTVSDLYVEKKIINGNGDPINTGQWSDPYFWPSFGELYKYWENLNSKKFDPSLNALLYDTIEATGACGLRWIDNHNSPDLDNDLLILDISALSLDLQNAFSVLMTGIINTRFFTAEDVEQARTFIFFDEGAKLLKIDNLKPFIEKMFRESRSACITTIFATQDPEGIGEDVLNFIKANCTNIFLLCNMKDSVIDRIVKVFSLKNEHKERLGEEGKGICLYLKHPYAINMDVVLEDMVENALLTGSKKVPQKVEQKAAFNIREECQWIYKDHGFFIEDWTENGKLDSLNIPGWTYDNIPEALGGGSDNAFYETALIKEAEKEGNQSKIGPEGLKHYGFVCQTAGGMCGIGYFGTEIHHNYDIDISAYLIDQSGKKVQVGVEIIMPESKLSAEKLQEKRNAAEEKYDIVIFTCPSDIEAKLKKALGAGYVYRRGGNLDKKLKKCKMENPGHLSTLVESTEALQAPV
jgi:hypothetical protein